MSKAPIPNLTSIGIDVEEEIASGGMGTVYRARRTGPGDFSLDVAVKVIKSGVTRPGVYREKILAEAALTAKLRHPNIVQVFDLHLIDGDPVLVMEWIDGDPLSGLIQSHREIGKTVPVSALVKMADQILSALVCAHEYVDVNDNIAMPIVHRDITPNNIMLDRNGVIKVLDFGVAKLIDRNDSDYTLPEDRFVNPAFATPEHENGGHVDQKSDMFQLGKTLGRLMVFSLTADRGYEQFKRFIEKLASKDRVARFSGAREAQSYLRSLDFYHTACSYDLRELFNSGSENRESTVKAQKSIRTESNPNRMKGKLSALLLVVIIIGAAGIPLLRHSSLVRDGASSSDVTMPRLIWRKSGKDIDLSDSDPRQDIPSLTSNLSDEACGKLCFQIETLSMLPFPTAGKDTSIENILKVAAQKSISGERLYLDALDEVANGAVLRPAIGVAGKSCVLHDYCRRAESTYFKARSFLHSIHPSSTLRLDEMIDYVQAENERMGSERIETEHRKTMPKTLYESFTEFEAGISKNTKLFPTDSLSGFDILQVDHKTTAGWNSEFCKKLGDWYYSVRLTDLKNKVISKNIDSYTIWIVPKANALKILGLRQKELVVDFYGAESSAIFQQGLCLYVRDRGALTYVRHWVPSLNREM